MKFFWQAQILLAILLIPFAGCANDDAAPEAASGGLSQRPPSIDSAFLARIDLDKSPKPVQAFIKAGSAQDLVGKSRRDFDTAFAHFDSDERDSVTFLNYAPPMSASAQRDFDQSHEDGTVIRRPFIFVRLVEGKIDSIQAYEPGL